MSIKTISLLLTIAALQSGVVRAVDFPQRSDRASAAQASAQHSPKTPGSEYETVAAGSGRTKSGVRFSFHFYKSADGVPISTRVERYSSANLAGAGLRRRMKKADKVLERSAKLGESGDAVGERLVIATSRERRAAQHYMVLLTQGSHLYIIESPSLPHLLAFEKHYQP